MQTTISCVQPNCGDWGAVSFLRRWVIMRKQKQEFYWFGEFLIDCRKTWSNHNSLLKTQGKKTNDQKRGKTQATKSRLGIGWRLIGWEHGGASFLDQSETDLKQNQRNPGLLSKLNWKVLCIWADKNYPNISNPRREEFKLDITKTIHRNWKSVEY